MSAADDIAAPVKNGVCLWCGSGVLESGEHVRDDLDPCATIPRLAALLAATEAERDEWKARRDELYQWQTEAIERIHAVEKERDEARAGRDWQCGKAIGWRDRAEAAEKERDEARQEAERLDRCLEREQSMGSAGLAREKALREAATAYLQRHQEMKGAVVGAGDFLLLSQAEDSLRAFLAASSPEGE